MSRKLTREAFRKLIAEDIAWLEQQPRTLERDHIIMALQESERFHYDLPELLREVLHEDYNVSGETYDKVKRWIDELSGPRGD